MRHATPPVTRRLAVLGLLAAVILLPLAAVPPARASDANLVLEALGILRDRYVDPVDVTALLNGAIGAMRSSLSAAGIPTDLAELLPGTAPAQAEGQFRSRFEAAAAQAGGRLTGAALAYAAIRGMTAALQDSHTGFLTPDQNRERQLRQRRQAAFSGIGVILMPREGRFYVRDVIPGSPAEAAGFQALDRIARIDGVSVAGMQTDQVVGMIRGPAGTAVQVVVQRSGRADPVTLTVTRAPISVPAILQARVMDGGIGYLQLYQFVSRTGQDVRGAVERMLAGGMRALVLDLRGNSGGFLHELTAVLNALLPPGRPIYQETTRGGQTRTMGTSGAPVLPANVPLVVLIDEGSASAAELLAAALQEHGRAVLLGARTAGAVEASVLYDLSDGSALSVTILRLATGQGRRLEGVGVAPDLPVALVVTDLDQGRDTQLDRAIQQARARLNLARQAPAAARR